MRHPYFYLLFSVFLSLYTALNSYIFIHGFRMTDRFGINKIAFTIAFVFFCFAYIVGELIQQKRSSLFSDTLITIGSLWFVGMVHFFFVSIGFDIFKLINIGTHWVDRSGMQQIAYNTTWITLIATLIFLCIGYINARTPAIHRHKITLKKKNRVQKNLTLAVASDIHLSPINGATYIERIVRKINSLKPDLILLPGDILDGEVDPVIRRDLGKYLKKFQAKYGIYGITGNHEYIGGIDRAAQYIEEHGITLLRDEFITVAGVTLIGREDIASARF